MSVFTETDAGRREPVAIRDVLDRQISTIQRRYDTTVHVEDIPDVAVEADGRLPLVFENLLRRAAQTTSATETGVRVSGARRNNHVDVEVVDPVPAAAVEFGGPVVSGRDATETLSQAEIDRYFAERILDAYDGELAIRDRTPAETEYRVSLPVVDG